MINMKFANFTAEQSTFNVPKTVDIRTGNHPMKASDNRKALEVTQTTIDGYMQNTQGKVMSLSFSFALYCITSLNNPVHA